MLVVEIDGWGHGDEVQIEHDRRRDAYMQARNYHVIRIAAADVMRDADEMADGMIRTAVGLIEGLE